MKISIN